MCSKDREASYSYIATFFPFMSLYMTGNPIKKSS